MIEDHKLSTKEIDILESKIFIPHLISNSTIIQYQNSKDPLSIMDIL